MIKKNKFLHPIYEEQSFDDCVCIKEIYKKTIKKLYRSIKYFSLAGRKNGFFLSKDRLLKLINDI